MYDTYGFPLDLTELILKENGMTLDHAEFDAEMAQQKARARNAASVETDDWTVVNEGEQEFVGYDTLTVDAKILRYRKVKQKKQEYYQVILSETPFYGEMGGQVGDRGVLVAPDGSVTEIYDTKRENGINVHLLKQLPADVSLTYKAVVDGDVRMAISCNHTATHLLHEALREVWVRMWNSEARLFRQMCCVFDFSHFQKLTLEEISAVEHLANSRVRQAISLDEHRHLPIAEARNIGAMALFGEKYGDDVRVVRYGSSVELCGGTHVANTGNIGMIKIMSESSVAAGIRRIEAITGLNTELEFEKHQGIMREIAAMFNNVPNLVGALRHAVEENAELKKQAEEFFQERVSNMANELTWKGSQHKRYYCC